MICESSSISVSDEWSIISMNHFLGSLNEMAYHFALGYATHPFHFITNQQTEAGHYKKKQEREREKHMSIAMVGTFFCCIPSKCTNCHHFIFACLHLFTTHIYLVSEVPIHWIDVPKKQIYVCMYVCVMCVMCSWIRIYEWEMCLDRLTASFELVLCSIITIHRFTEHNFFFLVLKW